LEFDIVRPPKSGNFALRVSKLIVGPSSPVRHHFAVEWDPREFNLPAGVEIRTNKTLPRGKLIAAYFAFAALRSTSA
jgi:hypothetical protein